MCLGCSLLFSFMVDANIITTRGEFYSSVLIPSHASAGLGLWWDRGDLFFLWILLSHPFSSLTPCTPRVLRTMSECAMYMGCWCLGVSMMLPSITPGNG